MFCHYHCVLWNSSLEVVGHSPVLCVVMGRENWNNGFVAVGVAKQKEKEKKLGSPFLERMMKDQDCV